MLYAKNNQAAGKCVDLALAARDFAGSLLRRLRLIVLNAGQNFAEFVFGDLGVITCLAPQPVAFSQSKKLAQALVGICRYGTFAMHDFVDAAG